MNHILASSPVGWKEHLFGTLLADPVRNGIYKTKEFHGTGVRVVNMGELFAYDFISSQDMKRVELTTSEKEKFCLNDGDLLFARRSLVLEGSGKCSLVVSPPEMLTFESSLIRARPNPSIASSRFLYYLFTSPVGRYQIISIASQTAVSGIRGTDLAQLKLLIPPLDTQRNIASVLSAYDDLIENNEKRIKALEEMAQLLYTEWFVKFKFPGHEKVKMVDSRTDLGAVPEGWTVVPMESLADFVNGYPFKPGDLGDEGLPVIKIPELRSGILDKTPRNSGEDIPKRCLIKTGDILFSWSATLLVNIWNSGDALLNQHLFKVSPKKDIYRSYAFYSLIRLVEKLSKHVVGATMQHLRRGTVVDAKVVLPAETLLVQYESAASKLLAQISVLLRANQNLSMTRDLLIPQLVTGKRELK